MAVAEHTISGSGTKDRELLIAYLNTGTNLSPTWSPIGKRVEDSSVEYDWQTEVKKDILGLTWATMKKPTMTQTFDPCELDGSDDAQQKIWKLAVVDQDINALAAQDMLLVHSYGNFAERYEASMIAPSSLGGEGGGFLQMPFEVTFGGTRTVGSVTVDSQTGVITFVPDTP